MAKIIRSKDPVKLHFRNLAGGGSSLSLLIYSNKRRVYENLGIALSNVKTTAERHQDGEKLRLAEKLRMQRVLEIQNGTYGLVPQHKKQINFVDYFEGLTNKRIASGINSETWLSVLRHLRKFRAVIPLNTVDETYLEDFKNYLLKKVHQNSAHPYFNKVKAALYQAYREKLIVNNPAELVSAPKIIDSQRSYLTLDELRVMAIIECRYPILKNAFLFSAMTGLRWSDIQKLKWSELNQADDQSWSIIFTQKKTKGMEYLPISTEAVNLIGPPQGREERVFKGLKYSAYHNAELVRWAVSAGITRTHVTFHVARHSFATLLLTMGTYLFTVSKLLGHRDSKTTQIYAKVVDQTKIDAINRMPNIGLQIA
jgi:integrase